MRRKRTCPCGFLQKKKLLLVSPAFFLDFMTSEPYHNVDYSKSASTEVNRQLLTQNEFNVSENWNVILMEETYL